MKLNVQLELNNGNATGKKGKFKTPLKGQKKKKQDDEEEKVVLVSGLVKTLKLLNVSKNRISDAGAIQISQFIKASRNL